MMQLAEEKILNLLWLLIPLIGFLIWSVINYNRVLGKFVEEKLIKDVTLGNPVRLRKTKLVFIVFVFVFSIFALMRPQWGFEWQEVKREGVDILVAIDTSKSMLTEDVRPNRLERTKLAVKDLLKTLKGDRIGLIAFAGEAYMVCPLTVDYSGFLLSLNDLDINTIQRGGTNVSKAIEEALKGYKDVPNEYKAVIIITDGDNLEGEPLKLAQKAKDVGVKIYTIGIGTKDGELIQTRDAQGQKGFLKDSEGNYVLSRLNESLLQRIALSTGGIYVKASGGRFGLDLIYERDISKLEKREIEATKERKYHERFQWPLSVAFLLLVMETCITSRKQF